MVSVIPPRDAPDDRFHVIVAREGPRYLRPQGWALGFEITRLVIHNKFVRQGRKAEKPAQLNEPSKRPALRQRSPSILRKVSSICDPTLPCVVDP
jgi:hypothetical protein